MIYQIQKILLLARIRFFLYFIVFFIINFSYLIEKYEFSSLNDFLGNIESVNINFVIFWWRLVVNSTLAVLACLILEKYYCNELNKCRILSCILPIICLLLGIVVHSFLILNFTVFFEAWVLIFFCIIYFPILTSQWKEGILYFLGIALISSNFFIYGEFGNISVDQLFSTLLLGGRGVLTAPLDLIISCAKFVIIIPLTLVLLILNFQEWIIKKWGIQLKYWVYIKKTCPIFLIIIGCFEVGKAINLVAIVKYYYSPQIDDDLFAKSYHNPANLKFTATQPKSLVYIYIESLETTYSNQKLFGHDLLQPLTQLKSGIAFSKFRQTSGSGWTIAGIVASQCSIPFKLISLFDGNNFGENVSNLLPAAVCLSDILKKQGYQNVFLNGVDLTFAGVGTFLKTHHYDEVIGKKEWLRDGFQMSDMLDWGLPDDLLFQQAKLKLEQLVKSKQLFNLTILTVNTHGPHGQLNKSCFTGGGRHFEDIVACTAYEVADFINYIKENRWLDKITIVVTGDHLAMQNDVSDKINQSPSRYIFNKIISADELRKNRETIFHVDIFPTVLQALGIKWEGNQLGLGYSAIGQLKPTFSEKDRFQRIERIVASKSKLYNSLWTG